MHTYTHKTSDQWTPLLEVVLKLTPQEEEPLLAMLPTMNYVMTSICQFLMDWHIHSEYSSLHIP